MGQNLSVLLMVVKVWMVDGGVSEQAVKQLFETVQSLCAAVTTLTNNMKQMMETVGQSNANPVNTTESEALRLAIREEVKEMKDREKMKSSIVVKGLEVPSNMDFGYVWKYILGPNKVLQLFDIVCIGRGMRLLIEI